MSEDQIEYHKNMMLHRYGNDMTDEVYEGFKTDIEVLIEKAKNN